MKALKNHLFANSSTAALLGAIFLSAGTCVAQSVWIGTDANMSTAANWSGGVVPTGTAQSQMLFNGSSTFNTLTFNGGTFNGNPGLGGVTIAAAQTSPLTITNVGTVDSVFRLTTNANVTIEAGAGGLTLGGSGAAYILNLNNTAGSVNTLTNNSTALATISANVRVNASGGSSGQAAFAGSGNWAVIGNITGAVTRGVLKNGTGTLTLSNTANAFTGGLTINEGLVRLGANEVITNTQTVTVNASGTLDLNGFNESINGLAGAGLVQNEGSGTSMLTIGGGNGSSTFSGILRDNSGAGSGIVGLTKTGTGTLTLNGDLTGCTGPLTLSGGVTNLTVPIPGDLTVTAGTANLSGAIPGNLYLSGGNTNLAAPVTGEVTVSAGATLNSEVTLPNYLDLNGGSIGVNAASPESLGTALDLTLTGVNTVVLTATPSSTAPFTVLTYGGTLNGTALDNLALFGGTTNYRSPVFNDATPGVITLAVGSESRTWNGGVAWDVNTSPNWLEGDNKFFQLDAVNFTDTFAGTVSLSGVLTPSSITVDSSREYLLSALAGSYIAGSGGLTKNGTGLLTLGGANTFTGNIAINGGVLKPAANQALGGNGKTITVASGATLDTNGVMTANRGYRAVISGTGMAGTGALINSTATGHNYGFDSITLAADAMIGGTGRFDVRPVVPGEAFVDLNGKTLTKSGTNLIALVDGSLTADGTIAITGGTLAFTRMNVSGAGPVTVSNAAILQFENNAVGSFSKDLAIDGATVRTMGNAFIVDSAVTLSNTATFLCEANLTLTNVIAGPGSLDKTGAATLILANDNTFSGGTTVSAGTLQLGNGGTTGSVPGDLTNNGTVAFNHSADRSFGNVISGSGALSKLGTNTLTLTTAQTYGGNTTINGGALVLGSGSNCLPVTTSLTLGDVAGARLDLNGFNQEIRSLGGGGLNGGTIANGGGTPAVLTIRPIVDDGASFAGVIDGNLRVVIIGDKTAPAHTTPRQRFAGTANTYIGGTLIDGGTLMARLDGSLGAIPAAFQADNITLQHNGMLLNETDFNLLTLDANRGITLGEGGGALVGGFNTIVTVQGIISGAASNPLTIGANNGTVVLTGNNTYAGDTILAAGDTSRLQIGDGGTSGTLGSGNVSNNGQLAFNRADDLAYAGVISGPGRVIQQGTGTLTLAGLNTYTGNTTVNAGTLAIPDNAGLAFVVTDTANTAIGGTGALTLAGEITIDTAAVTVESGMWTLVNMTTLNATVGATFTVAGTGWSETNPGVWKNTEGGKNWAFREATGILTLGAVGFDGWMSGFNFAAFPGADLTPTGDADGDGIRNAIELVIGNLPNETKVANLPSIELVTDPVGVPAGAYLKFSYRRSTAALEAGVTAAAQYATDLVGPWTTAANGIAGVTILEVANGAIPGADVAVYIPRSLAVGGKLFGRLAATVP